MDGPDGALAIPLGRDVVTDADPSFSALLEAQLDRSFRLATVILGSAIEAEEAVGEAAISAWRGRGRLRDLQRFDAWFGRIVVNECRDRLRARRRHPVALLAASEVIDGQPDGVDFRDAVHARDALSRAFETLEPDERIVLVLRFWNDLTVEMIADRLEIPSGTVKSRLHHASGRLRTALAAQEIDR